MIADDLDLLGAAARQAENPQPKMRVLASATPEVERTLFHNARERLRPVEVGELRLTTHVRVGPVDLARSS